MKSKIIVLMIAILGFSTDLGLIKAAQNASTPTALGSSSASENNKTGETIHLKVKGLVCDFCSRAIEKVFEKRPEVETISINLTTKFIVIRLKKDQSLNDETLRKLVTDSGYKIETIERE